VSLLIAVSLSAQQSESFRQNEETGESEVASEQPDLDSVSTGTLFLQHASGNVVAPILSSSVHANISGIVAKIELHQSFHNNSSNWVEGLYSFPMPDQAAINEKQYAKAKRDGKVAALVKQHRPNLFSTRFANIAPGERVSIKLVYLQTVPYSNTQYSLRIPLTLTPRYTNSLVNDSAEIKPPQVRSDEAMQNSNIDHSVSISGTIHGDYLPHQFSSPSHTLDIKSTDKQLHYSLQETTYLDRDFILEWNLPDTEQPVARIWRETIEDDQYLLASILPPRNSDVIPNQSRELILVIDTSSSMAGASINSAKAALQSALSGLKPGDKFNIVEFNSTYSTLFSAPQFANLENIEIAKRFIDQLRAKGGTEMLPALQAALGFQHTGLLRQVIFVTDGSVGYEDTVINTVTNQLRKARLFTVGIGTAPNQWFMRKIALAGRGSVHFIAQPAEVQKVMSGVLAQLETPALTNIHVNFDDTRTEYVPNPTPDLYANSAIIIAAKLGKQTNNMTISGTWGDTNWERFIDLNETPMVATGSSSVWAQRTLESLEDKQRSLGRPDHYRSSILRIALKHKLLSRYTSFVAIEHNPIRPPSAAMVNKKVPNLLPKGSQMQSVSFPQGATGSDTLLLLSTLFALASLAAFYLRTIEKKGQA